MRHGADGPTRSLPRELKHSHCQNNDLNHHKMENEPVFAGTAIIDAAAADLRSRLSQRDHDLALSPSGGVKASHIRDSEDTSLLSGEEGSTYDGQGNGSISVERRGEFKWQGENDFEGISWWNKPSVSA